MTRVSAAAPQSVPAVPGTGRLPTAASVLAVTARPGPESADLGGLLYAFRRAGASLHLLCLTRGEASPLNCTQTARLEAVRPWELQIAATVLGISGLTVASFPDGRLHQHPAAELTRRIRDAIRRSGADLLLLADPDEGDPDSAAVASAACTAARQAALPAVARTTRASPGTWTTDLGADASTARTIQKAAAAAHKSQSAALPELIRRLDLLDGQEMLHWLVPPAAAKPYPLTEEATCRTGRPQPKAATSRQPLATPTSHRLPRPRTCC